MSDNKKYYYLKLKENFFESETIVLLESMNDGILYSNILMKMYLKSLKNEGKLLFNNLIPYDANMISTITRQPVGVVEKALDVFKQIGLIEVFSNGLIYMNDIQLLIGKSSTEGERKKKARMEIAHQYGQIEDKCPPEIGQVEDKCPPEIGQVEDKCPLEIGQNKTNVHERLEYRDQSIEKEIKKEMHSPKKENACQQIVDMFNTICKSFPKVTRLSETRKKAIKARLNIYRLEDFKTLFTMAEESDFLKGQNSRDWKANFDWLIRDANMAKVLDGNYINRKQGNNAPSENQSSRNYSEEKYDFPEVDGPF